MPIRNILVIDDVLRMAAHDFDKSRAFIYELLEYRYVRQRPVIVTANARVQADDWSEIEEVMDGAFVRRLQQMAEGHIVGTYA